MARYAIDAVTLLHVLDSGQPIDPAHRLVAPSSIRSDVLELLLRDVNDGTRTEHDALTVHTAVTELRMRLLGDRVSRRAAWDLARRLQCRSIKLVEPIAIARLQADALVTIDDDMRARARGVTPLAGPDALH